METNNGPNKVVYVTLNHEPDIVDNDSIIIMYVEADMKLEDMVVIIIGKPLRLRIPTNDMTKFVFFRMIFF